MAEIINMPKLGFDMKEGVLVRWVKNEGDAVVKGDILAEIETDKATVEVESYHDGTLLKQLVDVDSIVPIGDPIAVIGEPGEKLPDNLLKQGDETPESKTQEKDPSAEPEEEKETPENIKDNEDTQEVSPGQKHEEKEVSDNGRVFASPLAKKMAEENQLNLSELTGSGPDGRIVKKDIEKAIAESQQPKQPVAKEAGKVEETKDKTIKDDRKALPVETWTGDKVEQKETRVPMNKLRQAITRRMVDSKQNYPHFYVTKNIQVDDLMGLYKKVSETVPEDQKVSINDFIIKATALALREFPQLNSKIDQEDYVLFENINIGVAVAIEGGLLTVVVKNADKKPVRVISREVKEMAARVRTGKIKPEDVEGSTFSISNMGMFDVENFAAIINPPEAAILAVGSAKKEAVVVGEEIKPSWRMKVTISADHRVTDGVEAAKFLQVFAYNLENPLRLLL